MPRGERAWTALVGFLQAMREFRYVEGTGRSLALPDRLDEFLGEFLGAFWSSFWQWPVHLASLVISYR